MQCRHGNENASGARFCSECGETLDDDKSVDDVPSSSDTRIEKAEPSAVVDGDDGVNEPAADQVSRAEFPHKIFLLTILLVGLAAVLALFIVEQCNDDGSDRHEACLSALDEANVLFGVTKVNGYNTPDELDEIGVTIRKYWWYEEQCRD
jgi:hypothetical protein